MDNLHVLTDLIYFGYLDNRIMHYGSSMNIFYYKLHRVKRLANKL